MRLLKLASIFYLKHLQLSKVYPMRGKVNQKELIMMDRQHFANGLCSHSNVGVTFQGRCLVGMTHQNLGMDNRTK